MVFCRFPGSQNHLGYDVAIPIRQIIDTSDMSSRNNEPMDWGMGVDVSEDHYGFVLIEKIRRPLACNDLTENAMLVHCGSLSPRPDGSGSLRFVPFLYIKTNRIESFDYQCL